MYCYLQALQYVLQPVLETLIYQDRQMWLKEHRNHSNLIPVFDEFISPRNIALVAVKSNAETLQPRVWYLETHCQLFFHNRDVF